jgi:hypothetical protein
MAPDGTKKGRKNVEALLVTALAAGGSPDAAANHAGCSRRTVFRRLQEPSFRAKVEQARANLVQRTVGKLSALGGLAADGLQGLLKDESGTVRLGATRTVLEYLFRSAHVDTLARLVEQLQEELERVRRDREHPRPGTNGAAPVGPVPAGGGGGPPAPGGPGPGPGGDHDPGGDDPGRLAGESSPLF